MENAAFPLDICEIIVGIIASQSTYIDQTDLRHCSLVCKDFVSISRRHIFRYISIVFDDEQCQKGIERLTRVLEREPSVATYIRDIYCSSSSQDTENTYQWDNPVFLPLLRLPGIRTLTIEIYHANISYDICSQSLFGFRALVEHYLMTGSLEHLKLHGFDDLPVDFLFASPGLDQLVLSACKIRRRVSSDSVFSKENDQSDLQFVALHELENFAISSLLGCSQLESLTLARMELAHEGKATLSRSPTSPFFPKLKYLCTWSRIDLNTICNAGQATGTTLFPSLNDLNVILNKETDIEGIIGIFDHVETLVDLEIAHYYHGVIYRADYCPVDLHSIMLKSRATLKSVYMDWTASDYSEIILKKICDGLESIRSRSVIENLSFSFGYKIHRSDFYQGSYQWKRFADIFLEDSDGFPHLKKVSLRIQFILDRNLFDTDDYGDLRQIWAEPLVGLRETSHFEFSLEVQIYEGDDEL
ncbi:hypothetical protein BJ165DRAFT_1452513 [Panaeolus papilionaceus]|nr:hypothetical protein BJ165DRAFT_1452513 [Panaeolus papilionaceus]